MIVVTGMHRSGTSLAALVLRSLGADFGPDDRLYDADRWNANGYLERVDAVDCNSRMITGHARTTGRVDAVRSQIGYLRMPDAGAVAARAAAMTDERTALAEELRGLFVKDPRFCITMPQWDSTTRGLVVALRHPSASVASLRRRNRLPERMGHAFWRWHMQTVLPHIGTDTLVIRQDLLTGPTHHDEVARIRRWLDGVAGVATTDPADEVIDTSLVHHAPSDDGVPTASLELWDRLLAAPAWAG